MTKIAGNVVGIPNPQSDWNQLDATKADFIKNKPTVLTENDVLVLIEEQGGGDGSPGLSAYEVAIKNGFEGSEEEWLLSLRGEKGNTGHGLEIKGYVETYEELPDGTSGTPSPTIGDIYQVGLGGLLYLWDGEWVFLGSYKGEQGPQGYPGATGDKGDKGDKGVGIDYILISDDEETKSTAIFIYDTEGNGASGLVRWGKDGYTPQKGVDYWTDADKAEIKSYVDEAILGGAW